MIVRCPHCHIAIQIAELNCAIFRCGVLRATGEQIPPHAPRQQCMALRARKAIWGCGRPFRVVRGRAHPCGYI